MASAWYTEYEADPEDPRNAHADPPDPSIVTWSDVAASCPHPVDATSDEESPSTASTLPELLKTSWPFLAMN